MASWSRDYYLLLEGPDPVEAELAQGLLREHGIPSVLQGQDRDLAELGAVVHVAVSRPDLLVRPADAQRARAILDEAWRTVEPGELERAALAAAPEVEAGPARPPSRAWRALSLAVLLLLLLVFAWFLFWPF